MEVAECGTETVNDKVEEQVKIEDCPESGDENTTVTIKLARQPAVAAVGAASESASEEDEEEGLEFIKGDNDDNIVEITKTEQLVVQEEAPASTTTNIVTVVEKHNLDNVGGATKTTVVEKVKEEESAKNSTTSDEPANTTETTVKVKKTVIATTSATPTSITDKEAHIDSKQQQQHTAEVVKEADVEEEETEEIEKEEEEEKKAKEDAKAVAQVNISSIACTEPQYEIESVSTEAESEIVTNEKASVAERGASLEAAKNTMPLSSPVDTTNQQQPQQKQQDNLSNTLKEIISDIDRDIEQQEDVANLKAQQLALLKQQQVLAQQISHQNLLEQQLAEQNKIQEEQLTRAAATSGTVSKSTTIEESKHKIGCTHKNESYEIEEKNGLRLTRLTKSTIQESHASCGGLSPMMRIAAPKSDIFNRYGMPTSTLPYKQPWQSNSTNFEESSNVSKKIDLQKIFTPATDAEEILPKNRKLYASSAFYSPTLHPTVEDQVELARRISHSLSDISNHQSKGQSMYVNRKKRSVKWVHEGAGKAKKDSSLLDYEYKEMSKENTEYYKQQHDGSTATTSIASTIGQSPLAKVPLKLVMNPRGQIRDFNSVHESLNIETGLMSPEKCAELVTALNTQKGKGAELFAKRRRKAEKWIVDETNTGTHSPSGLPDYHQYHPKPASPSIIPAYSDAGKHRVQLNMHQEKMIEKYAKPGLKVVKTPWEAALETGSASAAFVEEHQVSPYSNQPTPTLSPTPAPWYLNNRSPSPYPFASSAIIDGTFTDYAMPIRNQQIKPPETQHQLTEPSSYYSQRDLAYKPNIPQGWKAPSMTLPKELYVPKEIPLESYAPPPQMHTNIFNKPSAPIDVSHNWSQAEIAYASSCYAPPGTMSGYPHQYASSYPSAQLSPTKSQITFPMSKSSGDNYCSTHAPPKQQHLPPNSYQTVQQFTSHVPQVNFNPSPLPYDKLAKFDHPPPLEISSPKRVFFQYRTLGYPGVESKVLNGSPAPYTAQLTLGVSQVYPSGVSPRPAYGNGATSPTYDTLGSSRPLSQLYSSYGTKQHYDNEPSKLNYKPNTTHCQNFNNAARGWGSVKSNPVSTKTVAIAGHLPYSDF